MKISDVACIGAGLVGHSWATLFAMKGRTVSLQDMNDELLSSAMSRIKSNLQFLNDEGIIGAMERDDAIRRITATTDLRAAVESADYVQESVFESYDIKKSVFREMDRFARVDAILASSSSGLLMSEIQRVLSRPQRSLIAHPWNPPHLMPLVELVPGQSTSPATMEAVRDFMSELGKAPVILKKEVRGFIGNRLAAALWREAVDLVYKGVASVEDVDKAMTAGPGLRWAMMGPHLTYHLGGGAGGLRYFIQHLGPSYSEWWKSMDTWTEIPEEAAKMVVDGVKSSALVRKKSGQELAAWRDRNIIKILKALTA